MIGKHPLLIIQVIAVTQQIDWIEKLTRSDCFSFKKQKARVDRAFFVTPWGIGPQLSG